MVNYYSLIEEQIFTMPAKVKFVWPCEEVLDQMDDQEYYSLVEQYQNYMKQYHPSDTMYIPRRKTKEERQKEEEIHRKQMEETFGKDWEKKFRADED